MRDYDRLSGLDTTFLHFERPETPMHIGALTIFEGPPFFEDGAFRLEEVRALVASRLHLIPRFRKRLMPASFGRPIWVDDEHFDIANHVRLTTLPRPGTRAELVALFEHLQTHLLDRSRPLWELWFVEGLDDGAVALIQKTHHSLIDGISGVDVAMVLLDFSREATVLDAPEWVPESPPSPARLGVDTWRQRMTQQAELTEAFARATRLPRAVVGRAGDLARSIASIIDHRLVAPRTSLNSTVGPDRRFGVLRVPLDDVKVVRRAFGGTINDVVLAGVGGGLTRLLDERDELNPELTLKVFCPVSVRVDDERFQLGNRVSAMFVPLPVGEPDPIARLHSIQTVTADLKERNQAVGAATLIGLGEYAGSTLLALACRAAANQPFFNLICTNVPGPQQPLYCMGAQMLEAYPMVPLFTNMNLGIAVMSYCGALYLGLLGDREHWRDMDVLVRGIEDSFSELSALALSEVA